MDSQSFFQDCPAVQDTGRPIPCHNDETMLATQVANFLPNAEVNPLPDENKLEKYLRKGFFTE